MADNNTDESINLNELDFYLKKNVPKIAGQMDREQTPQMISDDENRILINF
jgi:hypothetical protein